MNQLNTTRNIQIYLKNTTRNIQIYLKNNCLISNINQTITLKQKQMYIQYIFKYLLILLLAFSNKFKIHKIPFWKNLLCIFVFKNCLIVENCAPISVH